MHVTVHYTAQIKAALGIAEESIDLPPASQMRVLIQQLIARHGEPFRELVVATDGGVLPSVLLCVGDEQVDPQADDPLPEDAVVTFLSAISGG